MEDFYIIKWNEKNVLVQLNILCKKNLYELFKSAEYIKSQYGLLLFFIISFNP